MNKALQHLDEALSEDIHFDFRHYWGEGLDIWKKNWVGFLGFILIAIMISIVLGLAPYVGQLVSSLIISPALAVGGGYAAYKLDLFDDNDFGHFFFGFKKIPEVIIASLIQILVSILCFAPFILAIRWTQILALIRGDADAIFSTEWSGVSTWIFLWIIPVIFVTILFTYCYYFIGIFNLSGINAVKYSIKFVMQHWIMVFIFIVLLALFTCLGIIVFFIGIIFTISMYFPLIYSSFKGITKLTDFQNHDNLESHLMET